MNAFLPKWAMLASVVALTLATGIAIGRFSALTSPGGVTREARAQSAARSGSGTHSDSGSESAIGNRPVAERSLHSGSKPEPLEEIGKILALGDSPLRMRRLLNFLDRLTTEELAGTYDQLRLDPLIQMHPNELGLMLESWAERDPVAALNYLVAHEDTVDWERETAVSTWAAKDPRAAIQWADHMQDEGRMNNWRIGAAVGAGASDKQLALDYLKRIALETDAQSAETARQATNALNAASYGRPRSFAEARGE